MNANRTADRRHDEDARREYWTRMMDSGYEHMLTVASTCVADCGEGLVSLTEAVGGAGVEVSFSDRPHVEGRGRLYFLRAGLIDDFLGVAGAMNRLGWVVHVEDAYRTTEMQRGLARQREIFEAIVRRVAWESGGQVPAPDLVHKRASILIALTPNVGAHMSGSALDVSVLRRGDRVELDRGAAYLEMSELTPMGSPFVSNDAGANRRAITEIFEQFGFVAYPYEFWHYSKGDAHDVILSGRDGPSRYGPIDFDLDAGQISPIENPADPLNSPQDIRHLVAETLRRLEA